MRSSVNFMLLKLVPAWAHVGKVLFFSLEYLSQNLTQLINFLETFSSHDYQETAVLWISK